MRRLRLSLLLGACAVWLAVTLAGTWFLTQALASPRVGPERVLAAGPGHPCPDGAPRKSFRVSLINMPLFLNRFGDVVPDGRMYIRDAKIARARRTFEHAADPFRPRDIIEPLVLRVNRGDCVTITFTNRLNVAPPNFERDESIFKLPGERKRSPGRVTPKPGQFAPALTQPDAAFDPADAPPASMHFTGLTYDVRGSDGTAVGRNPDSTVRAGKSTVYRLFADQEGEFQFEDGADLSSHATAAGNFIGSNAFGAFGAIIVEPPGASWIDVNTGRPLASGTRAVIQDQNGPDYREHVLFMHDEIQAEPGIVTRFCRTEDGAPPDAGAPAEPDALPEPPDPTCVEPTPEQLKKLEAGTLPALGGGDADALINGEEPVKLEWFAFNYRSEPVFNRQEVGCRALKPGEALFAAPGCVGEGTSLSSWPFGDPGGGDLVFRNYRGEPMKIRLFHGAEKETHTFHWHIHRWPFDPEDEGGLAAISRPDHHTRVTNPIDVQAVSPAAHYTIIPEGGAGSAHDAKPPTFGDVIFHCHLYTHFADGMWGLNRVENVLADGTRKHPDGTPVLPLVPLPDFPAPPAQTADKPGFPFFVPGVFGRKAPKPPLNHGTIQPDGTLAGARAPTPLELNAADPNARIPGAFFINPCPTTRADGQPTPLKVFDVAAIQLDVQYNDDLKWRNPQHRMYVLQEDKQAVLSGAERARPFSPLLNVGDCVEYRLTNELPRTYGGTTFDPLQTTNEVGIHQHMVQFDVLSSDGTANGWNYDQGADTGQTVVYRDFVSEDTKTNAFHDHFFPAIHQDAGLFGGSTVHPAGCKFFDPVTGEPVKVGTIVDVRCEPATDYHAQAADDRDYRSAALFIEDHVPQFQPVTGRTRRFATPQGVPVFPAKFPGSTDDYGVMGVNYSLEPFEARRGADPARLFSSAVHGDPATPMPRAYAGDRVRLRLFQLSFEESHGFNLQRFRWKFEPSDPHSNVVQAQHQGMLEYFDLQIPEEESGRRSLNKQGLELEDYLYFYGGAEDWFLGAWGIFRIAGCDLRGSPQAQELGIPPLQPLPDNAVKKCESPPAAPAAQVAQDPGNPCPVDASGNITAPMRTFHVVAINKNIVYNRFGDRDPNGLMYVLEEELAAVRSGAKRPEPLIIRANAGDCIEVTLTNQLRQNRTHPHCFEATEAGQLGFEDPGPGRLRRPRCLEQPPEAEHNVPGFRPFPVSLRVSINAKLVNYEIGSDGANVGYNPDSTVGPGQSILYRWYAPRETGLAVLQDRGDVQNHLHHGLYGALVIEPAGASYLNPRTGAPLRSGQEAVIVDPNGPDFREAVVLMNSDLSLFRPDGFPVADNRDLRVEESDEADDPEDQGEFSINYRNEPWAHRFAEDPDISRIFSSGVHGDPSTPVFRAYAGDAVRFRVAQAVGDPRSTGFTLHGHRWRRSPNDPESQIAATQGQFNPTSTFNIHLDKWAFGGAGGLNRNFGDYLYRSTNLFRHLTGGQWGIFRVFRDKRSDLIELPDGGNQPPAPFQPEPNEKQSGDQAAPDGPAPGIAPTGSPGPTTSTGPAATGESGQRPARMRSSTITIRYSRKGRAFHGVVFGAPACRTGRVVVLTKARPGRDLAVRRIRTSRTGVWSTRRFSSPSGRYYALVLAKKFSAANGDTVVCRGDRSPPIVRR